MNIIIVVFSFFCIVILGVFIETPLPIFATVCICYGIWVYIYRQSISKNKNLKDSIFWILFILLFTVGFYHKRTGVSCGFIIEFITIAYTPFIIFAFKQTNTEIKKLFFLIFIYYIISVISAFWGESKLIAALFQIATDFKFILFLLLGFFITWTPRTENFFLFSVRWIWVPLLFLIFWQWASPSSYFSIVHLTYSGQSDPLGIVPTRALGPFNHAATMASVTGLLSLITFSKAVNSEKKYYLFSIIYFLLLFGTTERVEIFSCITVIIISSIYTISKKNKLTIGIKVISILFLSICFVNFVLPEIYKKAKMSKEFCEFTGDIRAKQPRPFFYYKSVEIANQRFPLGSGPGTFAGAGAGKFNWLYYKEIGVTSYLWFSPMYLFETYWPHFIAETGWIGFSSYFLFIVGIIHHCKKMLIKEKDTMRRAYWTIAFSTLLFLFLTSLNGPTFEIPEFVFLSAPFVGIANSYSKRFGD
nr:hypothetical protein [uncultured Desulfobacter sp.]